MKPFSCVLAGLVIFLAPLPSGAQDPVAEAAAIAFRMKVEEDYKRLNATVEALLETQDVLRKRIEGLTREMERLREENLRLSRSQVTRDDLRKMLGEIEREIERNREADRKVMLETFSELRNLIRSLNSVPARSTPAPAPVPDVPVHTFPVEQGHRLIDIIAEYNKKYRAEGKGTISLDDVKRVNPPNFNPDLIVPGQKILIPEPSR